MSKIPEYPFKPWKRAIVFSYTHRNLNTVLSHFLYNNPENTINNENDMSVSLCVVLRFFVNFSLPHSVADALLISFSVSFSSVSCAPVFCCIMSTGVEVMLKKRIPSELKILLLCFWAVLFQDSLQYFMRLLY